MNITMTGQTPKSGTNKTIFDDETQAQIRKNLKEAVGYDVEKSKLSEKFKPEIHHKETVPFEGNVYAEAGNSLNTKEIDNMYKRSVPSLWWLVSQSLVNFVRRVMH